MSVSTSHNDRTGEWIALPGLFEAGELAASSELEVRAMPLLLVGGRVYYGVYARERPPAVRAKSAA